MLDFFIFALSFAVALTMVVRLARLRVRRALPESDALGLTLGFVGLVLLAWGCATSGRPVETRFLPPLILPSPAEVIKAFPPLHFDQRLVRSAGISFVRV